MPTATTSKSVPMRQTRESSVYRVSKDRDDVRQQWKQSNKDRDQLRDALLSVEQLTRKIEAIRRRILGGSGGGGGFPWQIPNKELDPTVAVGIGIAVFLSPKNPLCQMGMIDLISGANVVAMPGTWISLKAIPAQVIIASVPKYNVPKMPTPGVPAGTPLAGDLDGAPAYWDLLGPYIVC